MPQRFNYDLSHFSFMCGNMGRLQTLSVIPVVAGDSFAVSVDGIFRLSPLRRNLTVDALVDVFAFYVPHRHVYGDDWIDFIKQGIDESITFATIDLSTSVVHYLGAPTLTGEIPKWLVTGYNRIWNRYFRAPTDVSGELSDTAFSDGNNDTRLYGRLIGRPKRLWSTGINATVDASDREVTVSSNQLDILDLAQIQARYRTEQQRDWFGQYYDGILKEGWGSGVNVDADERATLIMRKQNSLSGYDVDGTDNASLGTFSGKVAGRCGLQFPRRFFPEHGALWIVASVRFPTIAERELHYLFKRPQPTYKEISGDPAIWSAEPPMAIQVQDFFTETTSSVSLGTIPYGQWYREHPSIVHKNFDALDGFTFVRGIPGSHDQARYHKSTEYESVFQSDQLGEWQAQCHIGIDALRVIPGPLKSIFAGATDQ